MAHLRAASLARRSSLLTTRTSAPYVRTSLRCHEKNRREVCSQSTKGTGPPNIPALYKALTRKFPSTAPDPKLSALLQSAQTANDAQAAVNVLTSHVTATEIHHTHVTAAVHLCLPSKPELAEQLIFTLTGSVPWHILIRGRALVGRYYTTQNDPKAALTVMNLPLQLLSESPMSLRTHVRSLHLGNNAGAWGVIIKSLMQLNYRCHACAVADEVIRSGVPITDGLLHLCIEALRGENRWEDANCLFESAVARGLSPSEMTIGSVLLALTSRSGRTKVERRRVVEVVDMVQSPSLKFLKVALMALSSIGAISRAERVFMELKNDGVVVEDSYEWMMAGLGNFVELLSAEEVDMVDGCTYSRISERGDQLWNEYLRKFARGRRGKSMLSKLLRVKTRCFRHGEGVDVLEGLVKDGRDDIVGISHITAVLGAVELACDVRELKRLMEIMEAVGLKHDMRSLGFSLGTLIGDGNLTEGVEIVRQEGKEVIEGSLDSDKLYHPALLLRRLRTLVEALRDSGVGRVEHVDEMVSIVERKWMQ